ncbi:MAG: cbb3-type cytochrome c oxidase subunit I [Candidatus Polarisedimenticolaceae bacterium]|nr:cbb3-type cytochrome c oxidase subunit I [Candidatus Polarisedimenticolaceae bacterium]
MAEYYSLDMPADRTIRRQTTAWLILALASLVIGGLFVILIVLSRTPGIQDIIPWVDFFKIALVIHVDMTVLVWFLAFAGVFWSLNNNGSCASCGWLPIFLAAAGMLGIAASPFLGAGDPLMNNYVPVLQDPIFFVALGIFGLGFTLQILNGLIHSKPVGRFMDGSAALRFGLYTSLIAALLAMMSIGWSYSMMPAEIEGLRYYELLFWGGGHVIQFTHTQLMFVAWLWLASASGIIIKANPRLILILFALGTIPVLFAPLIYLTYPVDDPGYAISFTWLMKYGGGLAAVPLGLILVTSIITSSKPSDLYRAERSALIFSILLFGTGGIIGFMITGSNVRVPAHYHGSIIGVTLAFMGITYYLLPRLGFRKPMGKWALRQPAIYGTGQMIWVLAMAYTGGHGVQRKTAGAAQGLQSVGEHIAMGLMGIGGIIAITGGIIYLVVVYKAMRPEKKLTT